MLSCWSTTNPAFLSGKTTEVVDERKRRLTAIKADLTMILYYQQWNLEN
jgi:hypothetical protein